ncbi:MAG: hypothetical protein AAF959_09980 [Cyanobacteria bacterium P01_D01_bin.56]
MDDSTALREKVLTLFHIGVTTPEICRELGVSLDTVIALLVGDELQPIIKPPPSNPKQGSLPLLSQILSWLSEPACHYGYSGELWTPSRLLNQFNLPRDTLYDLLKKADLTFGSRLRHQFSLQESYHWWAANMLPRILARVEGSNSLLYLLDTLRPQELPEADQIWAAAAECLESDMGNPVLVYGISSTGRIAGQLYWCRKQVVSDQIVQVMQGLLKLHPNQELLILASSKCAYQIRSIEEFVNTHRQLRLFIL